LSRGRRGRPAPTWFSRAFGTSAFLPSANVDRTSSAKRWLSPQQAASQRVVEHLSY
jgi:hypothetical protein